MAEAKEAVPGTESQNEDDGVGKDNRKIQNRYKLKHTSRSTQRHVNHDRQLQRLQVDFLMRL